MTEPPNTVREYSEYAAEKFLQTAVFVDDKIYDQGGGSLDGSKDTISPDTRKKATKTTPNKSQGVEESTVGDQSNDDRLDDQLDEYSPHDIITRFTKKKIVCSLYQPERGEEFSQESDIFELCVSADIVIVDWDIYGDDGARAIEFIGDLIKEAIQKDPEQLRLILVYTQDLDLLEITDKLYKTASQDIDDVFLEEDKLAFHTKNSRVSIFGKPGRERSSAVVHHVIQGKEIADVAVREFAELASGLLQATTLLGLAEIKKNSRKILSKFNAELDPAFLTHRAMCWPEEDAFSHIVPLLVSEIESVLEDALSDLLISESLILESLIRNWCQDVWKPGDHTRYLSDNGVPDIREVGESICLKGYEEAKNQFGKKVVPKLKGNSNTRKAAKILLPEEDDKSNHRFSRLMASRTFYGNDKPKTLSLGSIVYCQKDDKYLLCVQPICDSVQREDENNYRAFVFVEMKKQKEDPQKSSEYRVSHIIEKEDGQFVELLYKPKSYFCRVETFAFDSITKRVQSQPSEDGKPVFIDTSEYQCKYYWVDQLKTAHAQRVVEDLASDLSRVGLTESEWLRLLAK